MSPAKRKSAKPGRTTSVAARGGKARSKARGSALTKAVKVKGKTPAKGGDHRLAARGGAKIGARNGKGVACDLPREKLELLLDRDGGREDVLTHVPACHPCTTSLTVIASQRDAIRHLTAEPSGTAVEYLLERGARAGERKLADLVYELAKACMAAVQDLDRRVEMLERPRNEGSIHLDVGGIAGRSGARMRRDIANLLPSEAALRADADQSCRSCLAILHQLEGASNRHELAYSVALIHSGDAATAAETLRVLLRTQLAPEHRRLAYWNLMWALVRQRDFDAVRQVGDEALVAFPRDWTATYNLAVAAAWLRDTGAFRRHARELGRLRHDSAAEKRHRTELLSFEAHRFAEALGVDVGSVRRSFGLNGKDLVGAQNAIN